MANLQDLAEATVVAPAQKVLGTVMETIAVLIQEVQAIQVATAEAQVVHRVAEEEAAEETKPLPT